MENYLTDPTYIEKKYPGLVYHFINPIGEYYNPKFTELLNKLNNFLKDYSNLSPEEKIDYTTKVAALMEAWLSNEDNVRISISLNFRDIQLNNDKILEFISKYFR